MTVKIGENIPCFLQLFDGNVGKFVRATIRRPDNTVVGSPVTLSHVGSGLYHNQAVVMPSVDFVTVQFAVFDDAGFTVPSTTYSMAEEVVERDLCLEAVEAIELSGGDEISGEVDDSEEIVGDVEDSEEISGEIEDC
mgnify:CR=1 FL=1